MNNNLKLIPVICGSSYKNIGVDLLLDNIVKYLPSPVDIPPIYIYNAKNNEKQLYKPHNSNSFCAFVFKIQNEKYKGGLVYVRMYHGSIKANQMVYNVNRNKKEKITRLLSINADVTKEISELKEGQIGAIMGCNNTYTGDTLIPFVYIYKINIIIFIRMTHQFYQKEFKNVNQFSV